jgi:hypothetical protein
MSDIVRDNNGRIKGPGELFEVDRKTHRLIIPAEIFIRILEGEFLDVKDWEHFSEKSFEYLSLKSIVIPDNIIVKEALVFNSDYSYKNKIIIKGGIYEKEIEINNGVFQEFHIAGGDFNSKFKINGGEFINFQIVRGQFDFQLIIQGGSYTGLFDILGGIFKLGISITDTHFNSAFYISSGTFDSGLSISNSVFYNHVIIQNGDFKNGISIANVKFFDQVSFNGGIFNSFSIINSNFLKHFIVSGGSYYNKFEIIEGYYNVIELTGTPIFKVVAKIKPKYVSGVIHVRSLNENKLNIGENEFMTYYYINAIKIYSQNKCEFNFHNLIVNNIDISEVKIGK